MDENERNIHLIKRKGHEENQVPRTLFHVI
jgi:hypothetical protein